MKRKAAASGSSATKSPSTSVLRWLPQSRRAPSRYAQGDGGATVAFGRRRRARVPKRRGLALVGGSPRGAAGAVGSGTVAAGLLHGAHGERGRLVAVRARLQHRRWLHDGAQVEQPQGVLGVPTLDPHEVGARGQRQVVDPRAAAVAVVVATDAPPPSSSDTRSTPSPRPRTWTR
jgi:hypothetical protein